MCIKYINTSSNKLLNFYIDIDIFKIIETYCYWLHSIQLHDSMLFNEFLVSKIMQKSCSVQNFTSIIAVADDCMYIY